MHEGDRSRGEPERALQRLESSDQGPDLFDSHDLGERDDETARERAPGALDQAGEVEVERPQPASCQLGRKRLDPDPEERRERGFGHAGRGLVGRPKRRLVFLRIRSVAESILEVDAEVLHGLAFEFLPDASVQVAGSERRPVARGCGHGVASVAWSRTPK